MEVIYLFIYHRTCYLCVDIICIFNDKETDDASCPPCHHQYHGNDITDELVNEG